MVVVGITPDELASVVEVLGSAASVMVTSPRPDQFEVTTTHLDPHDLAIRAAELERRLVASTPPDGPDPVR